MMPIELLDWKSCLSKGTYDTAAAIQISTLFKDTEKGTYITSIPQGKYVTPHYHLHGNEEYHILEGAGIIKTAKIDEAKKIQNVESLKVHASTSFLIEEGTIHQLINTGDVPLVFIFICPNAHLADDRFIISEF